MIYPLFGRLPPLTGTLFLVGSSTGVHRSVGADCLAGKLFVELMMFILLLSESLASMCCYFVFCVVVCFAALG